MAKVEGKIVARDGANPAPVADPTSLATLAVDLKAVWTDPSTDARLKKRIVRTVIHGVIADIDATAAEIVLVIHWVGGVHSEIRLPRRRRGSSTLSIRYLRPWVRSSTKSWDQTWSRCSGRSRCMIRRPAKACRAWAACRGL